MSPILTLFEVMEIRELLSFKKATLIKSKLFFDSVKEHYQTGILEEDIELSIQEIEDLKHILTCSDMRVKK